MMNHTSVNTSRSLVVRLFASVLLCLMTTLQVSAQQFTAKVEDVGGYYRLTFTLTSSDASSFTPPSLAQFEVLSGPATSTYSSYQLVNGRASHSESTSFTYILSPKQTGTLTIGSATVRSGNRVFKSRPIVVKAVAGAHSGGANGGASHQRGTAAAPHEAQQVGSAITQRDLFIDVTPSRTRLYEQEAVLLTYRVHARVGVALANTQLSRKPDFKGIVSQEIPLPGNQIQTTIEHRNGTTYRTGTLLQYVLFPQRSGKVTIPAISFDCTVLQQDHTLDLADAFFNGGGSIGVQVKRASQAVTLQVDALPQPKPAGFSGAVGKFSLRGEVLGGTVRTNDVVTYRLTLSGEGNLKLIAAPTVAFPKSFDTYDPKTTEKTQVSPNGLEGDMVFDYTFVPHTTGQYTIPATEFVYFDTEKGKYETLRTQPLTLDVQQGTRSNTDVDKQMALLRSDMHPIHEAADSPTTLPVFLQWGGLTYWLLHAVLLLLTLGLLWAYKRYVHFAAGEGVTRSRAAKEALTALSQCRQLQGNAYFAQVRRILTHYLAIYCHLQPAECTREGVAEALQAMGLPPETQQAAHELFETCDMAQYAPQSDESQTHVATLAESVVRACDAYTSR